MARGVSTKLKASLPATYRIGWLDRLDMRTKVARAIVQRIAALTADAGGADKRNAVMMALKDPAISALLVKEIADICRVTKRTVNRMINEQMTADPDENGSQVGTKSQDENDSQKPTAADHRPTKEPPTQAEIERDELRDAMSLISSFPYGGEDTEKLGLSQDDIKHINYCIDWLTEALEAYVAAQYKPDADYDSENRMAIEQ